jgi:hypothetical protein
MIPGSRKGLKTLFQPSVRLSSHFHVVVNFSEIVSVLSANGRSDMSSQTPPPPAPMMVRMIGKVIPDDDQSELGPWIELPLDIPSPQFEAFHGNLYELRISPDIKPTTLEALSQCEWLAKIEIPPTMEFIGYQACYSCHSLSTIVFSPGCCLQEISGFSFCDSLTKIEIPGTVRLITEEAFRGCSSLCEVTIAHPSSIWMISGFRESLSLVSIQIPASLQVMDKWAFSDSTGLREVIFEGVLPGKLKGRRFLFVYEFGLEVPANWIYGGVLPSSPVLLRVPAESSMLMFQTWASYVLDWVSEMIAIPQFVRIDDRDIAISMISDRLFYLCVCRSIALPPFICRIVSCFRPIDGVVTILEIPRQIEGIDGFIEFHSLEMVKFVGQSHLRSVRGFSNCKSLQTVEIESSVEIIEGFNHCDLLKEVIFENPSRIRDLQAFSDCKSLETIELPGSIRNLWGLNHCAALAQVRFEERSQICEIRGFSKCQTLGVIEIPRSVEVIHGFWNCDALEEVIFAQPSRIRAIGGFDFCCLMNTIVIPRSVRSIDCFGNCKTLVQIIFAIPSSLRQIRGFDHCDSLCEIEIPRLVFRIRGFNHCAELRRVVFGGSELRLLSGFDFCPRLAPLQLPNSIEDIDVTQDGPRRVIFDCGTMITSLRLRTPPPGSRRATRLFVDFVESDLAISRRRLNLRL